MARGKQLILLVDDLRAEIGHSQNAALGVNAIASLKHILRRQQEALYDTHDWEHLKIRRPITLAAGQNKYAFPSDLNGDRALKGFYRSTTGARWQPVSYGITEDHYNIVDGDDATKRRDRVDCWQFAEDGMLEVWPRPATNSGTFRLKGIKKLSPLIADSDTADLDDILIVLHCAAEILAKQKSPDASIKLNKAQERMVTCKRNAPAAKNELFILGGDCDPLEDDDAKPAYLRRPLQVP